MTLSRNAAKNYSLTEGSVFRALFAFSFPLIVTNTITVLFHAADVAVLSIFADGGAVAAVGACGSLINLMLALVMGLATGANVLIAKRIGEGNEDGARRAIGTALVIAVISGFVLMAVALLFSEQFLILMSCQVDVLGMATTYMKIYFLGAPILMLDSFAVAILRSMGDSVRPMIYSLISGAVNVLANVLFVVGFSMNVEGVAIATVLASLLKLLLAFRNLFGKGAKVKIRLADVRVGFAELCEIVRIGVPTCFCAIFFYVANVILSSAVNSMSTDAMTANAISGQCDGIIYTVGSSVATATSVMVAQNYGARNPERIRQTMRQGVLLVSVICILLGSSFVILREPMLGMLSDSPSVIAIAKDRMTLLCLTYFVTSIMEVFSFSLRALKCEKSTMVVGFIAGLCLRCVWRWLVWPHNPTLSTLYACFPISAIVAITIYYAVYRRAMKRIFINKNAI